MKPYSQNQTTLPKQIKVFLAIISLFVSSLCNPGHAQTPANNINVGLEAKLAASDTAAYDEFGNSTAISGDTVVVGGDRDSRAGEGSDSVYVFVRSDGIWTQQAKLTASDREEGDKFGFSAAVSEDTVVVGAYGDDDGAENAGSAYVFTRSGGVWTQQAKLTASDAAEEDQFGYSVAVSGDTAVVGAYGKNDIGHDSGSVYVFTRSDGVWTQQAKLTASDAAAQDQFGRSVAAFDDTIVVGAFGNSDAGRSSGSAYIFVRSDGIWTQQAKLTAQDAAFLDHFGISVAVSGDIAVVGAENNSDAGTWSGSAYVFTRSGGVWTQQTKLTASDAAAFDRFGNSVAVSGDAIVVGAFGDSAAGIQSGAAYVFIQSDGVWRQQAKLTAPNAAEDDNFGNSVAVSGDVIVVGARGKSDAGTQSGAAYAFNIVTDENPLATLAFRSTSSFTDDESDSSHLISVTLAISGADVLNEAISIDLIDSGTGTATPDTDYLAFTPSTLIFPPGSGNGDTQTFELSIIQDDIFEGNETVELRLTNIQGPAFFGTSLSHQVNIVADIGPNVHVGFDSRLTPSITRANDRFAESVAISGDTAVVGAPEDDVGSGSVYVFTRSDDVWTQQAKLNASNAAVGENFGWSVAISGDTVVVGTLLRHSDSPPFSGSAYIFTRSDGLWTEQAELNISSDSPATGFGVSVAISGDTVLVGGFNTPFVYTRLNGLWIEQARLSPSDGSSPQGFGASVALSGHTAVVGAWADDDPIRSAGSAYVFVRSDGIWTQQAKLNASDPKIFDEFGGTVALSRDTAVIGNGFEFFDAAYVFTRSEGIWTQQAKLVSGSEISDQFGFSVAVSGDTAVVGATQGADERNFGAAYVFTRFKGVWTQQAELTTSAASADDDFGWAVGVSGSTAIIGARVSDGAGNVSGAANIYEIVTDDDTDNAPPTAEDDEVVTNPGQNITIDVLDNDMDVDGAIDPLSVTVTQPRYVASFDGMDDKIIWGKLGLNGTPSISKFIRFRTTDTSGVLFDTQFGSGADGGLYLNGGMLRLRCAFSDAGVQTMDITTTDIAADGQWHSAGFTYDGSTLTPYFDGAAAGTPLAVLDDTIRHNYPSTCGGRVFSKSGFFLAGKLADFAVYRKPLSEADVQNYHSGRISTEGLVLWGRMDENDYSHGLADSSGNGNTGTSVGAIPILDPLAPLSPGNGSLVNNGDGTITYTPNPGFVGEDHFEYTVRDNDGAVSNVATITIRVNQPPVADDDDAGTTEGQSVVINVVDNDTDGDGTIEPSTVQLVQPRHVASFDGVDDKIIWGDLGLHGTPMLSKFIRFRTTDTSGILFDVEFGSGADGGLFLGGGMVRLRCAFNDAGVQTMDIVTADIAADGAWHSAGFTYDGSTLTPYFDGAVTGTPLAIPNDTIRHNYPSTCGRRVFSNSVFFAGELSDFVVYRLGLLASEVARYHAGTTPSNNLVLWGKMNETDYSGGLVDSSGSGHSGVNAGAVPIVDPLAPIKPKNGSVVNNGDGTITYTPNPGFTGEDHVEYTVQDDDGAMSNIATVTITVSPADPSIQVTKLAVKTLHDSKSSARIATTAEALTEMTGSQTVYENAEDGTIEGWFAYGDGTVTNTEEPLGNRIIVTDGDVAGAPFRLGLADQSDWNNPDEFTASFRILMDDDAAVYFRIDTTDGQRYLCYRAGLNTTVETADDVLCFGLDIDLDGEWHTVSRNLANDLTTALPSAKLLSVKDFYVFGSVKLDDLMLLNQNAD